MYFSLHLTLIKGIFFAELKPFFYIHVEYLQTFSTKKYSLYNSKYDFFTPNVSKCTRYVENQFEFGIPIIYCRQEKNY